MTRCVLRGKKSRRPQARKHRLATAGAASGPYYPLDYLWDAAGNRVTTDLLSSPAIDTFTYAAGSNRLTARQETTHTGVVTNCDGVRLA